jgi:hypothetical protein
MHRFFAVLCLFGTLACSAPALAFQSETPSTPATADARHSDPDAEACMVGEVTDGDTFHAYCGGRNERIRVNGIDAPELRQSYGLQSSIEASRLLGYGSKVTLHPIEYDRYGRLVARVTLADGRDFARELVRAGYAWGTMKAATGAGFTITPHCASPRTGSWWPNEPVFPPQPAPVILDSAPPNRRRTSVRAGRRVRPERHNPTSIATLRTILARQLLRQLPQCPFCGSRSG